MTQRQLQRSSRVSRSYLARIECGLLTPSLGTVEKLSFGLGISLNRFFISDVCETLLEDKFIRGVRPFLHQLDWEQWQSILKRLAAISTYVSDDNVETDLTEQPRAAQIGDKPRPLQSTAIRHPHTGSEDAGTIFRRRMDVPSPRFFSKRQFGSRNSCDRVL